MPPGGLSWAGKPRRKGCGLIQRRPTEEHLQEVRQRAQDLLDAGVRQARALTSISRLGPGLSSGLAVFSSGKALFFWEVI